MDILLTDIVVSLGRAALATFLARELYSTTVPTLLVLSITVYILVTLDPLAPSLPPSIGLRGLWRLLRGKRKVRHATDLGRLSVLGRHVFWVSQDVLGQLLRSTSPVQIFHRNGVFMEYGEKERMVIDKVCPPVRPCSPDPARS
jgi:hypothetical protein